VRKEEKQALRDFAEKHGFHSKGDAANYIVRRKFRSTGLSSLSEEPYFFINDFVTAFSLHQYCEAVVSPLRF
jgi:hypothetical protein